MGEEKSKERFEEIKNSSERKSQLLDHRLFRRMILPALIIAVGGVILIGFQEHRSEETASQITLPQKERKISPEEDNFKENNFKKEKAHEYIQTLNAQQKVSDALKSKLFEKEKTIYHLQAEKTKLLSNLDEVSKQNKGLINEIKKLRAYLQEERTAFNKIGRLGYSYDDAGFLTAISRGDIKTASLFLEAGFSPNAVSKGESALIKAIELGYDKMVELLLNAGVNVNVWDNNGDHALILAAKENRTEIVRLLSGDKANANIRDRDSCTILMLAAREGRHDLVRLLMEKGADVNARNNLGNTVLIETASYGYKKIAELLIEKGADINVRNNLGNTALTNATYLGNKDIVRLLIEKGADVNLKDNGGTTALMDAVWLNRHDLVQLLIKKGADVNLKNNRGSTALMKAVKEGFTEIVHLLKKTK